MNLPRNKKLKQQAKNLRKNMTPQERHLWYDFLRNYPINVYRQRIIGDYIVDFYCKQAKIVIELDGSQHYRNRNIEYDNSRTEYFNALGLKVIRFSNSDVNFHFDAICRDIDNEIKGR